jgi:NhaA family Na+:H+ antiporter
MQHILGAGFLAGIGFTMSLFIANLAFPSDGLLAVAKVGILGGSLIAGLVGAGMIRSVPDTGSRKRAMVGLSIEAS